MAAILLVSVIVWALIPADKEDVLSVIFKPIAVGALMIALLFKLIFT